MVIFSFIKKNHTVSFLKNEDLALYRYNPD